MKKIFLLILIIAIGGAVYWYGSRAGWFTSNTPTNLPTAEDLERINAVEQSASQKAPDAKSGVGVVPKGSKPVPEQKEEQHATTTDQSGDGATDTSTLPE